jgi:metal-responsive CopG/Arc/MetJ family transcriptional regulator
MSTRRTHIILPEQLVEDIDRIVGRRGRSRFIVQAAETELIRLRQIAAIEKAAGTWKSRNHPELAQGAARWVSELRKESDKRLDRIRRR